MIDDEPLACDLIAEYLEDFPEFTLVGRAHDGFEGLKLIQREEPDLIFLDVQMPRLLGTELLDVLEEAPAVIFTTAFEKYAVQAFEQAAVDYLLKPFSLERFGEALQRFQNSLSNKKETGPRPQRKLERLVLRDEGRVRIIALAEIHRLEADGDYVKIHTAQGAFMKKQSLQSYAAQLPADQFVRVHRSHLLNLAELSRIDRYKKNEHLALTKQGNKVPVSRSGYKLLKEKLAL